MLRSPVGELPTVYLYERYPGGVGLSEKLFYHHKRMLEAAASLLSDCPCAEGCPSCVGSVLETGQHGKGGAPGAGVSLKAQDSNEIRPGPWAGRRAGAAERSVFNRRAAAAP